MKMGIVRRGDDAEICVRYRPQRMSEVIGNKNIVVSLVKAIEMGLSRQKTYLFAGSRGCGKTTVARIMALGLNCEKGDTAEPCLECSNCRAIINKNSLFVNELNMAKLNKKDDADAIESMMTNTCLTGRNKVFIFDEAHQMTVAAQDLMLKVLEEPPPNTYIFLCTTNPEDLKTAITSRCEKYMYNLPSDDDIKAILKDVVSAEKWEIATEAKVDFLKKVKGLSFREIVKGIDQFVRGGDIALEFERQEEAVAYEIVKLVIKGQYPKICEMLENSKRFDCEMFRRVMLGFLRTMQINAGKAKSKELFKLSEVIDIFALPYFESGSEPKMLNDVFKACVLFGFLN